MATLEQLLNDLKKVQTTYPDTALANPSRRDAWEYGFICGYAAGLKKAEELVTLRLKEGEKE